MVGLSEEIILAIFFGGFPYYASIGVRLRGSDVCSQFQKCLNSIEIEEAGGELNQAHFIVIKKI